jgi:hypothetical protein
MNQYSSSISVTYSEKRWHGTLWQFIRLLIREVPAFVATAISLSAFADLVMKASGNRVGFETLALPVGLLSFGVAAYRAWVRYSSYVPTILQSESSTSQSIYRKQRCGWHLALAHQMLSERIARAEARLDRVSRGVEFLEPRPLSGQAYFDWLRNRPPILQRLIHSVAASCTGDLPAAVCSTSSEKDLLQMKLQIEAAAHLYTCAENFEVDSHAVAPPSSLIPLHEMTYGWTDTIRDGVRQLNDILKELSTYDRKDIKKGTIPPPDFSIKFEAPDNLTTFSARLGRMRLEDLLEAG